MGQQKMIERRGTHKHGPRPATTGTARPGVSTPLGADEVAVLRLIHTLRAEVANKQTSIEQQQYPEGYLDGYQGAAAFVLRRLGSVSSAVINGIGQRLGKAAVGGFVDLDAGVFIMPPNSEAAQVEAQDKAPAIGAIQQLVADQAHADPTNTPAPEAAPGA